MPSEAVKTVTLTCDDSINVCAALQARVEMIEDLLADGLNLGNEYWVKTLDETRDVLKRIRALPYVCPPKTLESWTVTGPAHYASYFINDDASGLGCNEVEEADLWYTRHVPAGASVVDVEGEAYFSNSWLAWSDVPHTSAGDVVEYVILGNR